MSQAKATEREKMIASELCDALCGMMKIQNPRLRGRRLEPVEWRVRKAFSPFWSGFGSRFLALLICDEGLAAFRWPWRKFWPLLLLIGRRAGGANLPTSVDGDSWPLTERSPVQAPSALLFPWQQIARVHVKRGFWHEVRVFDTDGKKWVFTAADPRVIGECEWYLEKYFEPFRSDRPTE